MDSFMNDVSSDERADHAGEENFFSLASSCLTIFKDVLGSDREPKIETYFQDCFDESTGIVFNSLKYIFYLIMLKLTLCP